MKLGEICKFSYGKSLKAAERSGNGFPVYGSNGIVGYHSKPLTNGPTIIIGRKGSLGEVHFSTTSCFPIDTTYYITSEETNVDLKWLTYMLKNLGLTNLNRAAAIPGLNRKDAYSKNICLPNKKTQKRIAAILDKADALRVKRREAIEQLEALIQSTFLEMFGDPVTNPKGWEIDLLENLAILENGDRSKNYPSGSDIQESGILFFSTKNIKANRLNLNNVQFISLEKFEQLKRGKLKKYDLVISLRGSTGNCAVFDCDLNEGFINAQLMIIRPNLRSKSFFLHAAITSKSFINFLSDIASGAAVPQLTAGQIGQLRMIVPPMENQKTFTSIVESIEKQKKRMEDHLLQLDALFASLQSRAFSGELSGAVIEELEDATA